MILRSWMGYIQILHNHQGSTGEKKHLFHSKKGGSLSTKMTTSNHLKLLMAEFWKTSWRLVVYPIYSCFFSFPVWFTLGFLAVDFDSWCSQWKLHVLIIEDVLSSSIIMLPSTIAPRQSQEVGWVTSLWIKEMMGWSEQFTTEPRLSPIKDINKHVFGYDSENLEQWLMSLAHITVRPKCMNSIIFEEALSFLDKLVKETSPVTSGCTIIHRLIWAVVLHQWMKLSWNVRVSASFHPL